MSDTMFDDSLLATQESMAGVDWDNLESFGTPGEGQHLATIISVKGYMQNFANYTGPRAKVKFMIKEGADKGKFVYDDINLPHGQEKDGNVKRRALIASRMGLITKGSHETVQVNWKALEGRDVLITVEHAYSEKDGKKKGPFANVSFSGWDAPGTQAPPHLPPQDTPTFNSKTAACLKAGRQQGGFLESLNGILSHIHFHKNGFLIGRLDSGEAILGDMEAPCPGQEYRFHGDWTDNPKFGRQFKFFSYQAEIPQTTDGIYRYIVKTAKWVGPEIGRHIVEAFGKKTLEVLKHDPLRVATCIKGITWERAETISENLLENEDIEAAQVELEGLLGGHHLPQKAIPQLIEKYKSDAPAKVRNDPYILQEVRGVGFPTADRVAVATGVDPQSATRRMAATVHVLKEAAESRGHVWLPLGNYEERLQALIGIPSDGIAQATPGVILDREMVALEDLANDEKDVAGIISMLLHKEVIGPVVVNLEGLAEDQQGALIQALGKKVFILTGAPGTGKTFTLQRMIQEFEERDLVVRLAAPTGKAAKRMTEVIGRDASTIHRLLEPEPYQTSEGLRFAFTRGPGNPIQAHVVVIDEFSMVDISLTASLMRALDKITRLIIVGDHYQLPSVGPGSVLRDLLAAGIPSFELTQIKRNTGDIVQACHAIKDGRRVSPSPSLDTEKGFNLRHIEEDDFFRIQEIIRDLVVTRIPQRPEGYDPVWDVQVLSPMNEKTLLSCLHINELLQKALNPYGKEIKGTPFRIRDKVIQRKNETIGEVFVVNGDLGTLSFYDDQPKRSRFGVKEPTFKMGVDFQDPDRQALISIKDHHLALAYCLTIHKMQGSESPVIIIPVHNSFGGFFNRELIYTAISRARDICITVGQWGALEQAATRIGNNRRITRLAELIKRGPDDGI